MLDEIDILLNETYTNEQITIQNDISDKINNNNVTDYDLNEFINMNINKIMIDLSGGDWDDPTGRYIKIQTAEERLADLNKEIDALIKERNELVHGTI